MVNAAATTERRTRDRATAAHASVLGAAKLNPFGDLHTLQHLSARYARTLRGVFEPVLRRAPGPSLWSCSGSRITGRNGPRG